MGWLTWSLRVGRIAGIEVKLHWSFALLGLYFVDLRQWNSQTLPLWIAAFVTLFGCVLLHELGHAIAARWFNISTTSITLWPLGGFANLARVPQKPTHTLVIVAAGPMINAIMAGIAFVMINMIKWLPISTYGNFLLGFGLICYLLLIINAILAVSNLIPAYPLDGGMMLHAALLLVFSERYVNPVIMVLSWILAIGVGVGGFFLSSPATVITAVMIFFGASLLNSFIRMYVNLAWWYLTDRGAYYFHTYKYAQAIAYYNRVIATQTQYSSAYHRRGITYAAQGLYQRALEDVATSLRITPDSSEAYLARSYCFALLHDYDQVQADVEHVIRLAPNLPTGYINRGCSYLSMAFDDDRNVERALNDFEHAIQCAPNEGIGYMNLGSLYIMQGDIVRAFALFDHALACDAAYAHTYLMRGWLYHFCGDKQQALADTNRGLQLNPRLRGAYVHRSQIQHRCGRLVEARSDCALALQFDQAGALVFAEVDLQLLVKRQLAWALCYYDHAATLRPDDALVFHGRADALRVNDEHQRAIADYDAAIARAPERDGPYFGRARCLIALGQHDQAADDLQRVRATSDNAYLRRRAGELLSTLDAPANMPIMG